MLEVLVDVEGVEVFGIEPGQQHVDDDGDVQLFTALVGQVGIGELLVFDPLLNILVIEIELFDTMVSAEAGVVVCDDFAECLLLYFRIDFVVLLFCGRSS